MNFTEINAQFPPKDDKDMFEMIQFVKQKPFAKDYWNILKLIYKKAEQYLLSIEVNLSQKEERISVANLMSNFLLRLDVLNHSNDVKTEFPTALTVDYMKRRARRFMKELGNKDKELYIKIAKQIILNSNTKENKINPQSQLVAADILFGKSNRLKYIDSRTGYKWINSYHLHQKEERFAEYWDESPEFIQSIFQKDNLPDEVYDFAVKLSTRNEWGIPLVNEKMLVRFFNSSSIALKKLAVQKTYAEFSFRVVSPELYAGLWLYADLSTEKRINEINKKRNQNAPDWYKKLAEALAEYTFEMLKNGNANKRVMRSIDFLQQIYPDILAKKDWTPMAKALMSSPVTTLRNIGFAAMKKADFSQAFYWLEAWLSKQRDIIKDYKEYERFVDIFYEKCPKNISANELKPFIFAKNTHYFLVEFAWNMSLKNNNQWYYYQLWSKITSYYSNVKFEQVFMYSCQSPSGRIAFERYFRYYSYNISYLTGKILDILFEYGNEKIKNMFTEQFVTQFINNLGYYLKQLVEYPEHIKQQLIIKIWDSLYKDKKEKNFFSYYSYGQQALQIAEENDFALRFLMELFEKIKITDSSWKIIINNMFNYPKFSKELLTFLKTLSDKDPRVLKFIENISITDIQSNARIIPSKYIEIVVKKLSWEAVLDLVANTNNDVFMILQPFILPILEKKQAELGFWKKILEQVIQGQNRQLGIRLLENPTFFELFLQQKDLTLLDMQEQEYEDLLLQWVQKNTQYFEMESQELFKLCMHKIPKVREFGLHHAEKLGMTLVFALRFFESNTPDMVNFSKKYFNEIKIKSIEETEAILAMCDSPNKNVRQFGLEYLNNRKQHLAEKTLVILECLTENADTLVQTFVSKEITEIPANNLTNSTKKFIEKFDDEMLRLKNKGRKTKEFIKNRVENTLQIDTKTLINLARVGTKADKEWAIEQMTKKALAGENIDGFILV
ncbi:MAG: hypothetical protein EAZ85_04775 [Bacteroidetes bacterium]|nr:MAG: hypothetical protein EAZ85_04775 [Bacteroidota bacterium]TAG88247.1 MAG: hypothetical protein EAZ20_08925 [Bacteroidota bacterium]